MRVETNTNLVWDDNEPKCRIITSSTNGQMFAFIQCLDKPTGYIKRYWGAWTRTILKAQCWRLCATVESGQI